MNSIGGARFSYLFQNIPPFSYFRPNIAPVFTPTFAPMPVKVLLDERGNPPYSIIVRVSHKDQRRKIPTGFRVEKKHFQSGSVVKHSDSAIINARISDIVDRANRYFAECKLHRKPINLDFILQDRQGYSFNAYLLSRVKDYEKKEMLVMATKIRRINKELLDCFGHDLFMEDLTQDALRKYEQWLIVAGNQPNTRHKKYEFLHYYYNCAILEGKAQSPNPFKIYKIKQTPVKKEKLTTAQIEAIEDLKLRSGPTNDARNIFLFSYYTKGQRFETCLMCKKEAVSQGRIHFRSNKGLKYLSVKIHPRLKKIIDQYKKGPGEYLFPYLLETPASKKAYISKVGSFNAMVNAELKTVAALAGIKINLSMHIARHTFAFHLKQSGSSIHVIKDALGHSKTDTTEIYLKALDDEVIDKDMERLYGK